MWADRIGYDLGRLLDADFPGPVVVIRVIVAAADATALAALVTDYTTRLATATTPATRTKSTIAAKDTSKAALRAKAASFVRIINALPNISPTQRFDLGLNPKDSTPTPIPVPATSPQVAVDSDGVLTLHDASTPSRRGKPRGVVGAVVFTKVQPASAPPPVDTSDTAFSIIATRARVALPLPADADTKKLYVLARWFNERGELGPVSNIAVSTIAA